MSQPIRRSQDTRPVVRQRTPMEAAQFVIRLCGAAACPERTAAQYRENADSRRKQAVKAASSPTGKNSGYTEAEHLAAALEADARAISVPAAMRELMK